MNAKISPAAGMDVGETCSRTFDGAILRLVIRVRSVIRWARQRRAGFDVTSTSIENRH